MNNNFYFSIKRQFGLPKTSAWLIRCSVFLLMAFNGNSAWSQVQWRTNFLAIDSAYGWIYNSAVSAQQFRDGYMYFSGTVYDSASNTYYGNLSKINQESNSIWSKRYVANSKFIDLKIVDSTKLLILGSLSDSNSNDAAMLIKMDSAGTIIWKHKFTEYANKAVPAKVLQSQNSDSVDGYVWVGATDSSTKIMLMKVSADSGNIVAANTIEILTGMTDYVIKDLIQTSDGNYVICGKFNDGLTLVPFIAKIAYDLTGVLWVKKIEVQYRDGGTANSIIELDSSGIKKLYCIGTGYGHSPALFNGTFILRCSENADTADWCNEISNIEGVKIIEKTSTSLSFIAKWPQFTSALVCNILKTGNTFNKEKEYPFNSSTYNLNDLLRTKDGGYAIVGVHIYSSYSSRTVVNITKTSSSGNLPTGCSVLSNTPSSATYAGLTLSSLSDTIFSYSYDDTFSIPYSSFDTYTARCNYSCGVSTINHSSVYSDTGCGSVLIKATSLIGYNYYLWRNSNGDTILTYENYLNAPSSGIWTMTGYLTPSCSQYSNSGTRALVLPKPNAGFDTTYTPCLNYMQFNDTSTVDTSKGKLAFWLWNFDYPSMATDSIGFGSASYYAYPDTGSYTVRLVAFANNGCSDTAFKTIHIDTFGGNPPLEISSSSPYWHPYNIPVITITPSSNTYTAYKWYRNGSLLTAPCCPSYNAIQPGDYRIEALGDCGWEISNTISLRPDCADDLLKQDFASGARLNSSNYSNDTGYYVGSGQSLTINSGALVAFTNTTLVMGECSEIRIEKGGSLNLTNTKIVSCGNWKGIWVKGDKTVAQGGASNGYLYMDRCYLSDAAIGVYAADGGYINLQQDTFENNYVHVGVGPYFSFHNTGSIDSCTFGIFHPFPDSFDSIPCKPSWWPQPPMLATLSGDSIRIQPGVYLDSVKTFRYVENDFTYNRFYTPPLDAVFSLENRQASLFAYGSQDLWVQASNFQGPQQYGMMLKKVNGDSANYFITNWFRAQPALLFTNSLITGAYIEETENLYMDGNEFTGFPRGIEYYNHDNTITDTITGGLFQSNSYGLTISPTQWPYTTDSVNTDTGKIKLIVKCNEFDGNGYAISGSGNIIDQQAGTSYTSADIGNLFTNNQDWDLIWQDFDTPYFKYHTASPLPPVSIDTANNSVSRSWVILNGVSINNPYSEQIIDDGIPNHTPYIGNGCRAFFKTDPNITTSINNSKTPPVDNVKVYPNPFNGQVYVKFEDELQNGSVELYDLLGRMVLKHAVTGKLVELTAGQLATGFYILIVKDGQEIIHKEKLLKEQGY